MLIPRRLSASTERKSEDRGKGACSYGKVDPRRSTPLQRRASYLEPLELDELDRAITLVAEGRVKTVVEGAKPLEEVNEAFDALQTRDLVGCVVLDVEGVS